MIPLVIFLLACVAIYLGCIGSAFSVLMRLSLRLQAERSDSPDSLAGYLDDPILLFAPVRLLLGLVTVAATTLIGIQIGFQGAPRFACPNRRCRRSRSKVTLPLILLLRDDDLGAGVELGGHFYSGSRLMWLKFPSCHAVVVTTEGT